MYRKDDSATLNNDGLILLRKHFFLRIAHTGFLGEPSDGANRTDKIESGLCDIIHLPPHRQECP